MVQDGNKTDKPPDSKKCSIQHTQFSSGELILMSNLHSYEKCTGQEGIQHMLLVSAVLKRTYLEVCYGVWVCIMGTLLCGGNFLPRQTEGYCPMVQRKVEELCAWKYFSCLNFLFHLFMKKKPI